MVEVTAKKIKEKRRQRVLSIKRNGIWVVENKKEKRECSAGSFSLSLF